MRRLILLAVMVAMAAPLAACGRKGNLVVPENSTYPRTYPDITFPETKAPAESQ